MFTRSRIVARACAWGFLLATLVFAPRSFAAAEARSLYGIHDHEPSPMEYLSHVEAGGGAGWVTATVAVGKNPNDTSSVGFAWMTNAGHTVIGRLNHGYFPNGTIPLAADYDNFARRCSNFVANSTGCHLWVIGNELNLPGEWPFTGTNFAYVSPQQYATCFRKVYNAIKAVRPNDRVLPAPPAPFAGPFGPGTQNGYPHDGVPINWTTYLNQMLTAIAASGPLDGVALHINSRGYAVSDIHSAQRVNAGGQSLSFSFYVYRDWVNLGIPPALWHLPLYATECNGYYHWSGGHPENSAKHYEPGWMQEIFAEVNRYNRLAAGQGKPLFRCVNMYRWCFGCDGWNIDGSPYKQQILADLDSAVAQNHRWPDGTENRTNLISAGALWRFLDNGSDAGSAWRALDFNDSAWAQGPAQLGYGDGDENTLASFGGDANNKHITTYFRRAFQVADAAFYTNLTLRVLRDDGVIVYLNGTEIFRNNLPGGVVNYRTLALNAISGAEESTAFLSAAVSPALLRTGTNVVAVEIHQNTNNSSDISFDLELLGRGNARPEVRILSPANGTFVGGPTNVTLSARATDDYAVTRLDWWMNGVHLASQSPAPFTLALANLTPGVYTFCAVVTDGVLASTSAPVTITIHTALIRSGAAWKYLDDGSDQGTAWRHGGFNDAAWQVGLAQLGYGEGDEATVLSFGTDSGNKHVTYYFRHQFPVPDPAAFTNALVRLLVDDGAVVYVNGVAVIRRNMPSGPINYLTLASTTVGSADETNYFHVGVRASEFVAGINTLAVEVHQAQRTSGDVSFDLEMIGQAPPPAARLEAGHNDTSLVLSWPAGAGAFVLETTPGLNGEPWVAVTNAVFYTNRLFRTSVARGGIQQFFRLRREP